jgi:hypothetical protein
VFTILVLVALLVVGGAATVGAVLFVNEKRRRGLPGGSGAPGLPSGPSSERLLERTVRDLRVGDVLTIDNRDFVVEGTVSYDEDGHRWTAGRLVDGDTVQWLVAGIERVGASTLRLLRYDPETEIAGYPPETLVIGDARFALDKRGTATARLAGDVGNLAGVAAQRPENHVERCRWWLYNAAGDATVVLEQWGGEYRVLRGSKVAADTIELIPGS